MSASAQQEVSLHYQTHVFRNNQSYILKILGYLFLTIIDCQNTIKASCSMHKYFQNKMPFTWK